MKTILYKAADRGGADHGWLKAKHYFSFGGYQDPAKVRFGLLRVLNDDFIAGGGAFPTHPHDNMEIVTIPFTGALQHKDSTGGAGIIQAGDVQIMSAGKGVEHSEANNSATDPVTLFQVWLFPKEHNIEPRYDQRNFGEIPVNDWQVIVSPLKQDDALWINQDARFSLASINKDQSLIYKNAFPGNGMFLVVIEGKVNVGTDELYKRDAIGISGSEQITIKASENSRLLLIEVPMN